MIDPFTPAWFSRRVPDTQAALYGSENLPRILRFALCFILTIIGASSALAQQAPAPSLSAISSWAYQLQSADVDEISANPTFDLIVMDYSRDGTDAQAYSPAELLNMKRSGKKIIAYLSIGEAEDYRSYWQAGWKNNPPPWLGPENPDWQGNYKVRFWIPEWQNIIFNYLGKIIDAGFDGVYLDIIDAYYYWQTETGQKPDADSLMMRFVISLRAEARKRTGEAFFIIPQNGEEIIFGSTVTQQLKDAWMNAIQGVGIEDLFFPGNLDEDNEYNPDQLRLSTLQEYTRSGKRIFSIEYLRDPAKISRYLTEADARGFVPYVSIRALDQLKDGTYQPSPVDWKPYFTLMEDEGISFFVDSTAVVPGGGVPVLNIANDKSIILTSAGGKLQSFEVRKNGTIYIPLTFPVQRGPDGGCVYLPDGRTRLLCEEPAPGNTPQKHKSRIVSWISSDGKRWIRESGIRYQPGAADDSISSVPSVLQVRDSVWRMYYVGDFYRTNGTRTAISTDWGWSWTVESNGNILKRGDVDPQPVFLSNGRVRLYFRSGFGNPDPKQTGIARNDSPDGLNFDTLKTRLIIPDDAGVEMLKLDPSVIRFPNGDIACYIGAAPRMGSQEQPKLIAAWAKASTGVRRDARTVTAVTMRVAPHPMREEGFVYLSLPGSETLSLTLFDILGRKVAVLAEGSFSSGTHAIPLRIHHGGSYLLHLRAGRIVRTSLIHVIP